MPDKKINAYLVAAGMYHDIDHARLELLKLLAEHPNIRTKVACNYKDIEGIQASDFLNMIRLGSGTAGATPISMPRASSWVEA